jgi:hypothetical protein
MNVPIFSWCGARKAIAELVGKTSDNAITGPHFKIRPPEMQNVMDAIDLCNRLEALGKIHPYIIGLKPTGAIRLSFWSDDKLIHVSYTFRSNKDFFAIKTVNGTDESEYNQDIIHKYSPTCKIGWLSELPTSVIDAP